MCNVMDEIREEVHQEEIEMGMKILVLTLKDLSVDRVFAVEQLEKRYGVSPKKVSEVVNQYWAS